MSNIIKESSGLAWHQQTHHLLDFVDRLAGIGDKAEVLRFAASRMGEFLDAETVICSSWDPEHQIVQTAAVHASGTWQPPPAWHGRRSAANHPLFQFMRSRRRSVQFDLSAGPLPAPIRQEMEAAGLRFLAAFPLLDFDRSLLGYIEVLDSQEGRALRPEKIALGELLTRLVSVFYERVLLAERDAENDRRLASLTNLIAADTAHPRTEDALQGERRISTAMVEAAKALTSSLNLSDVLEKILEQTMRVMDCQTVNVMLIEGELARVVEFVGYGGIPDSTRLILNKTLPLTTPTLKRMLETKKPVVVPNTDEDPTWVVVGGNERMRSYAGAPLLVADDVIGFLNLDSERTGFFQASDTTPLEAFASIAASVLRNALRYNSVQERAYELEIVRKATLTLTASLDLSDVLTTILRQSLDLFTSPRDGHIFLYNDGRLHFGAAMHGNDASYEIWAEPREDGLTYTVARSGLPIIVDDMRSHPLFRNTPENWTGSIIGLPLKYGGDVVGVMNIAHLVPYQFKDHEIRVLSLLADQAAISIVNARLHHLVQEQSLTDSLTGLHNRRSLSQRLEEEVHRSQRYGRSFSLVIMDLNGFKKVNDTFGHPVGDQVLVRISRCLRETVRNTDFLARYGGDEFALIMPETSQPLARQLTARLHETLRECDYGMPGSAVLPITISIGIAQFPEDATASDGLIAAADRDLYLAKSIWRKSQS